MALELKTFGDRTTFSVDPVDGWRAEFRVRQDRTGRWVVSELRVVRLANSLRESLAPVPEGGITKAILRALPLQAELRYARQVIAQQVLEPAVRARRRPGPGRPPLTLAFYRELGARWNKLVKAKDPHPAKTLAEQYGRPRSTMRVLLWRYDEQFAGRNGLPLRRPAPRLQSRCKTNGPAISHRAVSR